MTLERHVPTSHVSIDESGEPPTSKEIAEYLGVTEGTTPLGKGAQSIRRAETLQGLQPLCRVWEVGRWRFTGGTFTFAFALLGRRG